MLGIAGVLVVLWLFLLIVSVVWTWQISVHALYNVLRCSLVCCLFRARFIVHHCWRLKVLNFLCLTLSDFSMYVAFIYKTFSNLFPKTFCGSVRTDLFMCLVRVVVRQCTSGSPHTLFKRKIFGSCCIERSVPLCCKVCFYQSHLPTTYSGVFYLTM